MVSKMGPLVAKNHAYKPKVWQEPPGQLLLV